MVASNSFQVVTYNILAKSLAANTIPWVMTVSPSVQERIENYSAQSFRDWVGATLTPEYLSHFHKNFQSGDYSAMRGFWGTRHCNGQQDIPKELAGLTWVDEDQAMYGQDDGVVATTLRGVAKQSLPPDLFHDFFQDVMSAEEQIYSWTGRGPRIFERVTQTNPDIIALEEYDCHSSIAEYRDEGCSETFADAMEALGYDGAFFKDPLKGRDPPSGLGVFWKRGVFEPVVSRSHSAPGGVHVLDCDQDSFDGALFNADMNEMWHPRKAPADGAAVLMPAADRRNAALARLLHKPSGKTVSCCAAHLMTTSRDSVKTNWYPGEVRVGELATLKGLVEARFEPSDSVLLIGDFNTNADELTSLFSGTVCCSDSGVSSKASFDTGFDAETKTLRWASRRLTDAFADVHDWGDEVGMGKQCTSHNAVRVEWIDYIWHDFTLQPVNRSNCKTPPKPIPDENEPSDHLPLHATFQFV